MATARSAPAAPLWWRILRRVLAWVILFVVLWCVGVYLVQRSILFTQARILFGQIPLTPSMMIRSLHPQINPLLLVGLPT